MAAMTSNASGNSRLQTVRISTSGPGVIGDLDPDLRADNDHRVFLFQREERIPRVPLQKGEEVGGVGSGVVGVAVEDTGSIL